MHTNTGDPYLNLAAEEFLLKQATEDYFLIWQSNPVVVVGKHQNTLAEVNYRYVRNHNISIARRLTGGGTVYHDQGNLNFSFIRNGKPGKLVDFSYFIKPVIGFLKTFGIEANQGPKNEILVMDKKISGNAEHVFKNRTLHHGTLLFNADLDNLNDAIRPGPGIYSDKAVRSNRSSVVNLAEYLNPGLGIKDFQYALMDYMIRNYDGKLFEPDENQRTAIRQLAADKYETWEWIYGWSPDYEFANFWRDEEYELSVQLKTHRGIITHCLLQSPVFPFEMLKSSGDKLTGTPHEEKNLYAVLQLTEFAATLTKPNLDSLVMAFF
jgi:lipoate-protein ligase A